MRNLKSWNRRKRVTLRIYRGDGTIERHRGTVVRRADAVVENGENYDVLRWGYYILKRNGDEIPLLNSGKHRVQPENNKTLVLDLRD